MRKPLLSAFFLILFLFAVPGLFYLYLLRKRQPIRLTNKIVNSTISFSELKTVQYTPVAREFISFFNSLDYAKTETPEPYINWDFRKTMIYANILDFSRTEEINFEVLLPKDKFSGIMTAKITCTPEQTARFSSNNLVYLGGNADFFEHAKVNDGLYAYCLNENCTELGKLCAIIEF